jgi:hypothetical protein
MVSSVTELLGEGEKPTDEIPDQKSEYSPHNRLLSPVMQLFIVLTQKMLQHSCHLSPSLLVTFCYIENSHCVINALR